MNSAVSYERKLTESYMVISAGEENLNEKILMKLKPKGLLPIEKYYLDGEGQFWYCISGKQSLETYCRIHGIGIDFLEKLIVSICAQVEILSKCLISIDCLVLDAEQVFINNGNQEVLFTAYPGEEQPLNQQFRQLMEYMLTRLDHKDQQATKVAYTLYEKTLDEGYSIQDLRDSICEIRKERGIGQAEVAEIEPEKPVEIIAVKENTDSKKEKSDSAWMELWRKWKSQLFWAQEDAALERRERKERRDHKEIRKKEPKQKESKQKPQKIYYPDETIERAAEQEEETHPTICLSDVREHPDGLLLYEGYENMRDIHLKNGEGTIGKGSKATYVIEKDTVSKMHARIICENQNYYIEDLNSTNGTYINGKPLAYHSKQILKSNDIVRFADVQYRFI